MRLPWIGPREQACMLAEKERSSLELDLPSLLCGNGPGSGESLSVEEHMSVERALLSIINGIHLYERSIYTSKENMTVNVKHVSHFMFGRT